MGLCFSICKDGEEARGDRAARDDQGVRGGPVDVGDKMVKDDHIATDDQIAADKQILVDKDNTSAKEDNSARDDQTAKDNQVFNDDQIIAEEMAVQGDQTAEGDESIKDKNMLSQAIDGKMLSPDEEKAGDNKIFEATDEKISDEDHIAELCRKYSSDNPIPEEESELFLKELTFPIPTKPHLTLSEDDVAGKRIFVIGDVHGCYDNLLALLHVANLDSDPNAMLIFVGDIINKGPKSCEVLNFVRSSNSYCVMGNHERSAVRKLRLMKMNVGYEPKASKQWLHDLDESDYEYLKELPYTISIPSLYAIIVHGGLLPGKPLEDHTQDEMLLMRNIITEGKQLKATKHITQGQLWGELWKGPQHVYFGHHALEGLQRYPYATGLDTGCVYHGSLTGVFLTGDKKLVSVKNEGCRNEEVNKI